MAGKFRNMMMLFAAFLLVSPFLGCAPIIQVRLLEKRVKQLEVVALQKANDAQAKAQECCQLSIQNAAKAEAAAAKAEAAVSRAEEAAARADSAAEILSIFLYEGSEGAPQ